MRTILSIRLVPRGFGESYELAAARVKKPEPAQLVIGHMPNVQLHYLIFVCFGTKIVAKLGSVRATAVSKVVRVNFKLLHKWLQRGAVLEPGVLDVLTDWRNGGSN